MRGFYRIGSRIFTEESAAGIWAGRKTETRRVEVAVSDAAAWRGNAAGWRPRKVSTAGRWDIMDGAASPLWVEAPFAPGDALWMREPWRVSAAFDRIPPRELDAGRHGPIEYLAAAGSAGLLSPGKRRPAMYMPRRFSRCTLMIEEMRLERVMDITEAGAEAEGVPALPAADDARRQSKGLMQYLPADVRRRPHGEGVEEYLGRIAEACSARRIRYAGLWDELNAARGYPWSANPFVWVYRFKAYQFNVDSKEMKGILHGKG